MSRLSDNAIGLSSGNSLLAALPEADYRKLLPYLKQVPLATHEVLYQFNEPVRQIYFVNSGVASCVMGSQAGASVGVGLIGAEGVLGSESVLEWARSLTCVTVQASGSAWRIPADVFRLEFQRGGALQDLMLRHLQALAVQASQSVLCNSFHHVEAQLCRWLLMVHDRIDSDGFKVTHEVVSSILGTRRASVTEAACALRQAGLIDYQRGHVVIHDRQGLESKACECYAVIRDHYDQLLGQQAPAWPISDLCTTACTEFKHPVKRAVIPAA